MEIDICYVLIVEDRHMDVEVSIYLDKEKAIKEAKLFVEKYDYEDEEHEELNEAMIKEGWIYYARCSGEGDCVRVVERSIIK